MDELERIKREKMKRMIEIQKYPGSPIKVDDKDFESTVAKYPLVVIDFWADWCPPCKMLAPIVEELAKKYKGRIVFGKLDVSANKMVPTKFGIRGIPTLLIFNKGKLIDRIVGVQPMSMLETKLNQYLR